MGRKKGSKNKKNYPVIECLEARLGTEEYIELALGLVLMIFGFISPIICFLNALHNLGNVTPPIGLIEIFAAMLIFFGVFGFIGVIFFINFMKPMLMMRKIKSKGKEKDAIVYEYTDDDNYIDGVPTQVVKLLVEDKKKPIFIYYQLGKAEQPYEINSKVRIKMYRNIFRIIEEKENK